MHRIGAESGEHAHMIYSLCSIPSKGIEHRKMINGYHNLIFLKLKMSTILPLMYI